MHLEGNFLRNVKNQSKKKKRKKEKKRKNKQTNKQTNEQKKKQKTKNKTRTRTTTITETQITIATFGIRIEHKNALKWMETSLLVQWFLRIQIQVYILP